MSKENLNTAQAETTQENPVAARPEAKSEKFNAKGHERIAKFMSALRNAPEKLKNMAAGAGKGIMRLFKGTIGAGMKVGKEAVATVLSADDLTRRGIKSVKEAAGAVKDAIVGKTREGVTYARESLADAYHTTKEKGEAVIAKGRSRIAEIVDRRNTEKMTILIQHIEGLEDRKDMIQKRIQQSRQLLAALAVKRNANNSELGLAA